VTTFVSTDLPHVKSVQMPLGPYTRVFIIIDGPVEPLDFKRLHRIIDVLQESYCPGSSTKEPEPVDLTQSAPALPPKKRVLRKLPPCQKHPNSERSVKTNRCLECEKLCYANFRGKVQYSEPEVVGAIQ
jgi:hypothetical protein